MKIVIFIKFIELGRMDKPYKFEEGPTSTWMFFHFSCTYLMNLVNLAALRSSVISQDSKIKGVHRTEAFWVCRWGWSLKARPPASWSNGWLREIIFRNWNVVWPFPLIFPFWICNTTFKGKKKENPVITENSIKGRTFQKKFTERWVPNSLFTISTPSISTFLTISTTEDET